MVNDNLQYIDIDKNEEEFKQNALEERYDDVVLTIEVLMLLSWKYSDSQQRPKERGSAEFNLKDLGDELITKDLIGDDEIRYGRITPIEGKDGEFEIQEITDKIKQKLTDKLGKKFIEEKIEKAKNENIKDNDNDNENDNHDIK